MLRRDYIQRMIEEYGKVLSYAMGLQQQGREEEARREINDAWLTYFNEEPDVIRNLLPSALLRRLLDHHGLSAAQIEIFAQGLRTEADLLMNVDEAAAKDRYVKALALYEYVEINEPASFSIVRRNAIEEIKYCISAL